MSVVIEIMVANQKITASSNQGIFELSGGDDVTKKMLTAVIEDALDDYSPASGALGAYLSHVLRQRTKAQVTVTKEVSQEKGVVY